jgi:hypothetical protein
MTRIKLQNAYDLAKARQGTIEVDCVRTLEMDGLVNTSMTLLVIPEEISSFLGLPVFGQRPIRLADGRVRNFPTVGELCIEILGRTMNCDAVVMPVSTVLIGHVVLTALDLVVNTESGDVGGNPDHPDGPVLDALSAA